MATDYYRLRVQGLHQFEYNECVLHFKGTNLDVADYIENAEDLNNSWVDVIQPLWNEMFPVTQQTMRLSASKASAGGGGEIHLQFALGSQIGIVSGQAASQQLCPVVRLIPGMGVKTAGKVFLPCIAESDVNANVVQSSWTSNLDLLMDTMIAGFALASITWSPVIYSRSLATFSDVVTYDTSPIIGFQRRRQRSPL